jgi:alanine dehydrogenase
LLILSHRDVESLLDLDRLIEAVAAAMADLSAGRSSTPSRIAAHVPEQHALLAAMPTFLPSAAALTTKLVSLFPHNRDWPTHQAVICCFDPVNGTPVALMDGTYITAARTAACSALATKLLARDPSTVAIVGTGTQARAHALAFARLPGVRVIRVAGRDARAAEELARGLVAEGIAADPSATIETAVRSAGVVCATTHAERPVVRREWLRPGTHVNSVGYNSTGHGEIDSETVRDAFVVVESRAAALAPPPSGAVELRRAIECGLIDETHIASEIGELITGLSEPTESSRLTLYKSVGVAVQDAAAAALVLRAARENGIGAQVDL